MWYGIVLGFSSCCLHNMVRVNPVMYHPWEHIGFMAFGGYCDHYYQQLRKKWNQDIYDETQKRLANLDQELKEIQKRDMEEAAAAAN
ncbi:hypothetical protein NDN08_002028 [Rhodosorus marinus]|uniref:Uncharacterized protein n=1 Tax=Rhodosorus marinus TaxID=101924 RepID=A0AAV8UVI2_9RHOD|nr:hypothetical protein NDN08_002028 [Rhodosorus marinus]